MVFEKWLLVDHVGQLWLVCHFYSTIGSKICIFSIRTIRFTNCLVILVYSVYCICPVFNVYKPHLMVQGFSYH